MANKSKVFMKVADICKDNSDKVTVVGTGDVGMAVAFSILAQGISSDVAIIDMNENKMVGEMFDVQHGCLFLNAKISSGADYEVTKNSKVCIITAGVRQKEGESRLALVQRNADILKTIIPKLVQHSPNSILIVVTNPCDLMTYVAWKISGFPLNRVFGSGTSLDTSRFRFFISQQLEIAPASVHGWIVGEHGDSSIAVWSGVNVCGVHLKDIAPAVATEEDTEKWKKTIHQEVISAAGNVIKLKGFTSWAIGLSSASLVKSILRNSCQLHAVSTNLKGHCGIDQDVFLSMPCVLGSNGVTSVLDLHMAEDERCSLKFCIAQMLEITKDIQL